MSDASDPEVPGSDPSVRVHPQGLCESGAVGARTRVWAFAHILPGAVVGADCNVCDHAFVEGGVFRYASVGVLAVRPEGGGETRQDAGYVSGRGATTLDDRAGVMGRRPPE